MMDTKFDTKSVPSVTPVDAATTDVVAPALVTQATDRPLGVLVCNVSFGATIFLAFDPSVLQNLQIPQGAVFTLQPGKSEVIVMAPRQKLFACTNAAGTAPLSIQVFEVALAELVGRR